MKISLRVALLSLYVLASGTLQAQLPQTRLSAILPPGGQQGTSVDVTVTGGTDLDELTEIVFSHPGITAVQKLDGNGNPITNKFSVTINADVPAGLYDVRIRGLFGISNPRIFRVGHLPEIAETEPNNTVEQAQEISLNTTVNARSNGGADVDMFRFNATAGQTVVFRSDAARLDSLMQPVLQLFDSTGRRVAMSRRVLSREAVIVYRSETDQQLLLKVHDVVYAGSNDYVYRLSVDDRPVIDYTLPPILIANQPTEIQVFGRHLPEGQATDQSLDGMPIARQAITIQPADASSAAVGAESFAASLDSVWWNGVNGNLIRLALAEAGGTVTLEDESLPADQDQSTPVPAILSGTFGQVGDEDRFRFEGTKGAVWQIDVISQRLGLPSNPVLVVEKVNRAEDGTETFQRLALQDDGSQNPGGNDLPTLTTDPSLTFTVPDDGLYRIRLKDLFADSRGEPDLVWCATIRPSAPDYQLVVFDSFPSADGKAPADTGAISLRKGGSYQIPIYAYRSGGHNSEINIAVEGLPEGVTCAGAVIPAGQASTTLVFSAAEGVAEQSVMAHIVGTSADAAGEKSRTAQITTLVHGGVNGLPRTGRVAASLLVNVMKDQQPFSFTTGTPVVDVSQDQQLLVPINVSRRDGFDGKIDFAFAGQPGNVDVPQVSIDKGQTSAVARFYFKENAPAGKATLLVYGTSQVPYRRNPWQAERAQQRVAEAEEQLKAEQAKLTTAKTAVEEAQKMVTQLSEKLKVLEQQVTTEQTAEKTAKEALAAAVAKQTSALESLNTLKQQLAEATSNKDAAAADFDAALKAVQQATAAVQEAAGPVTALGQQVTEATLKAKGAAEKLQATQAELTAAKTQLATYQQMVEKTMAAAAEADKLLKQREAEKKAAEDAAKKAEEAAKARNLNVRTIGVPVILNVHTTPGKLAAAVPNSGALKKGESIEVKVTLTRKNEFAGACTVQLVPPPGNTQVSSNTATIAADQTEATVTVSAAADAAAGDIANAVIRATAEFNGRMASFDIPVGLKIVE
jgi:hypothetical protein